MRGKHEDGISARAGTGIKTVLAGSFARLHFRSSINSSLIFITCKEIVDICQTGDTSERVEVMGMEEHDAQRLCHQLNES